MSTTATDTRTLPRQPDLEPVYESDRYADPRELAEDAIANRLVPYRATADSDTVERYPEFEQQLTDMWDELATDDELDNPIDTANQYVQTFLEAYALKQAEMVGYSEAIGFWEHDQKNYDERDNRVKKAFTDVMYFRNGAVYDEENREILAASAALGETEALKKQDCVEDALTDVAKADKGAAEATFWENKNYNENAVQYGITNDTEGNLELTMKTVDNILSHPAWTAERSSFSITQGALNLPERVEFHGEMIGPYADPANGFYRYHTAGHEAVTREELDAALAETDMDADEYIAADDPAADAVEYIGEIDAESLELIGLDADTDPDTINARYETAADVCKDIESQEARRARFILLYPLIPEEDERMEVIDERYFPGFGEAVKTHDAMSEDGHPEEEKRVNGERMTRLYHDVFTTALTHLYEDSLSDQNAFTSSYDETMERLYGPDAERPSTDQVAV